MRKIKEIIRFYSLDEIENYIKQGGEYPLHHIWCYDQLKENDFNVSSVDITINGFINKIGKIFNIYNLQQQLNCLKQKENYDLVFAPFFNDIFFIAFLRSFGLFNKPIITIADSPFTSTSGKIRSKLKQKFDRYTISKGVDKLLFLNETIYNEWCKSEPNKLHKNIGYLKSWGIDLSLFDRFLKIQQYEPACNYVLSTGGTNRDFDVLIKAFNKIDFELVIATKSEYKVSRDLIISSFISIDTSIKPGLTSVSQLLPLYYNSIAVAIPLEKDINAPNGITVIFEALALGKAVITTKNRLYPFDVEAEGVGLNVNYGDVDGWISAIEYMIKNPNEAKRMGEKGRKLCREKYNYLNFSKEVVDNINFQLSI